MIQVRRKQIFSVVREVLILVAGILLAWGLGHLVFVFIAGGLFTILYAVKRNLGLLIIARFTVDFIAVITLHAAGFLGKADYLKANWSALNLSNNSC
ncbi:MAG: hypothetical protein KJN96_02820 [Eudoraea sp.]|nr:hypothetical protein [Eudoraea sp.]